MKQFLTFRRLLPLLVLAAFVAFAGCDGKQDLNGSVTFPDGTPLDRGMVYFCTPTFIARGAIQPDGSFDVGSLTESDGLPPGTYKVYVDLVDEEMPLSEEDRKAGKMPKIRSLVDRRFCSAETTPLTFTVPGEGTFNIVVEPADPPHQK
ncbi:MAG: hypothetical protein Q4G68_00635 [Planctomycetia bacterium]|nr:hypothetical protein [Planctomycetia bacterium]